MDYLYEVREGDAILATGQLAFGRELQAGDEIPFGDEIATIVDVVFGLAGPPRLVLKLR